MHIAIVTGTETRMAIFDSDGGGRRCTGSVELTVTLVAIRQGAATRGTDSVTAGAARSAGRTCACTCKLVASSGRARTSALRSPIGMAEKVEDLEVREGREPERQIRISHVCDLLKHLRSLSDSAVPEPRPCGLTHVNGHRRRPSSSRGGVSADPRPTLRASLSLDSALHTLLAAVA